MVKPIAFKMIKAVSFRASETRESLFAQRAAHVVSSVYNPTGLGKAGSLPLFRTTS